VRYTPFLLLCLACSGSPAEPEDAHLRTDYGTVTVIRNGLAFDAEWARESIEQGVDQAIRFRPDAAKFASVEGMTILVQERVELPGDPYGAYFNIEDAVWMHAGVENVLIHEVGDHRMAWKLGNRGECYLLSGHRPGRDLYCKEIR
jgi:hypothetical protein